jgi:uncharacterized protein YceH (UPF0502 family)
MEREPPLAKLLPRQPGTKEARYAHLLSGDVTVAPVESSAEVVVTSSAGIGERLARLEDQVATLQSDMADLKQQLATFRKQFE